MSLSAPYGILVSLVMLSFIMGAGIMFTLAATATQTGESKGKWKIWKINTAIPTGLFLSISFAFGSGLYALFAFGFREFLESPATFLTIVAIAGTALFIRIGIEFARYVKPMQISMGTLFGEVFSGESSRLSRLCLCVCLAFVISAGLSALLPPVEIDSLAYHLALPKLYLESGRIIKAPSIIYSFFPLNTEMLYTVALAAKSAVAPAVIHFAFGIFTVVAMSSLASRITDDKISGPLAALIFLAMPLVFWEMRSAYNDLASCLCIMVSLAAAIGAAGIPSKNRAGTAGFIAGLAVAAKMSAAPYVVLILATMFFSDSESIVRRIKSALVFALFCFLPLVFWMGQTAIWTGNPVFPFMYDIFGGRDWNPSVNAEFMKWHMGYGPGKGPLQFILMPYYLFFKAGGNFGWPVKMPDRELGYLLLVLLPLLFLPGRAMKHQRKLTFFVAAGFVIWFFGSQQLRFLLNFLPILCVLYAAKIVHFTKKERAAGVVFGVLIAAAVGWQLYVQKNHVVDAVKVLAGGPVAKEKYIEKNVPSYKAFKALDGIAAVAGDKKAKAGLIFETRSFYSETPMMWLDPSRQGVVDYNKYDSGEELLGRLRELDVDYLLVNTAAFARLMRTVGAQRAAGLEYSEYFERFFILYFSLLKGPDAEQVWSDGTFTIFMLRNGND